MKDSNQRPPFHERLLFQHLYNKEELMGRQAHNRKLKDTYPKKA